MSDPHSVNLLESNDVLESEIAYAEEFIKSAKTPSTKFMKSNSGDDDSKESELFAMTIRLQLLQSKLQILVYNVQSEMLSIDEYLNTLRERIKRDQVLALYLKNSAPKDINDVNGDGSRSIKDGGGGVKDALRVMGRVRIMKKEVADAEESSRNSGDT